MGSRRERDIRAIVHDEPRTGFILQLDDAAREVEQAAPIQTGSAEVYRNARAASVHHAPRAFHEVRAQDDLVARDGVKYRDADGIRSTRQGRGDLRLRAGHRPGSLGRAPTR